MEIAASDLLRVIRKGLAGLSPGANHEAEAVKKRMNQTVRARRVVIDLLNGILLPLKIEVRRRMDGYDQDGLNSIHNHDFLRDRRFVSAYDRGVRAAGQDYHWHWRVHVGLWAAQQAQRLDGDFVECGVNSGALSSAIMEYLNWNALERRFFLFDTFCGLDERYSTKNERATRTKYTDCYDEAKANFEEFKNVRLIRGSVPETLPEAPIEKVCYLSLDMNCARPEVEAAAFFWDKLCKGALILLDDYAYKGYESQKRAMDDFAASRNVEILSLPTGQGLLMKP